MQISAQHLAELLVGIARAQAAIVNGIELQNVAQLRDHPQPTLVDLPLRILVSTLERGTPDAAAIARDLERLCQGQTIPGSAGKDLDFGAPPP
jgi:hypothetical protein